MLVLCKFCKLFIYFNNICWCFGLMFLMVFRELVFLIFVCFLWCLLIVWLCDLLWICWIICSVGEFGGKLNFLFFGLKNSVFSLVLWFIFLVMLSSSGWFLFYEIFSLVKIFFVCVSWFLLLSISIIFGILLLSMVLL